MSKLSSLVILIAIFSIFSCQKDNNVNEPMGTMGLEITDAPIDDASVEGAFVTVTNISVDGQSMEGFSTTTVDLLALQNGNTELLGTQELETGTYSELVLELDYEQDANGNAPGCYIMDTEGNKHALASASNDLIIEGMFEVNENEQTQLVADFDLRKTIQRGEGNNEYSFVSQTEMESGVRLVEKDSSGIIAGNCSDDVSQSDKIVVYAYKEGTYDKDTETSMQGEGNLRFKNAVSSSVVSDNGNYELHFLEKGSYELHFASYRDQDNDGTFELQGTLLVDVLGTINLSSLNVEANSTVSADVSVTGLLPI